MVVFGNPRAGTPLMESNPRVGTELPRRIVIWDSDDSTVIGYNDPRALNGVYEIDQHAQRLETVAALLADLAQQAAG